MTVQNASDNAHEIATFSGAFVLHYDYDGTVHYEITDAFKNFLTSHGYQGPIKFWLFIRISWYHKIRGLYFW
ncbi:hypothetical protein P344_04625 [Spiroplasma mirum ATCC 29335]|uniref:Uncharacterized protein n=1 Tax=Spiroplasma mirum ATCC 29335 TaxID=838561 RepID=W0GQ21_9MOLU|nr:MULTISPECIES: hypothetical protein [Spiroplasma]AHF61178.1 hypothetical protein SMM_0771 [Spiroplasma mirum ATCC 29335]AHI58247.1 hypothetical protein P344_04625 [Spiroplasma mirum ATCC 29335]